MDVVLDRGDLDAEPGGDLFVGITELEQPRDLPLANAQAAARRVTVDLSALGEVPECQIRDPGRRDELAPNHPAGRLDQLGSRRATRNDARGPRLETSRDRRLGEREDLSEG